MSSSGGPCVWCRDSTCVVDCQASCLVCCNGIPFPFADCDLLCSGWLASCWARGLSIPGDCSINVGLVLSS